MIEKTCKPTPSHLRDYCTIDRAARLLKCEVEDILQWGATGAINLMVNFSEWNEPVFGSVMHRCPERPEPDEAGIITVSGGMAWYSDVEPFDSGNGVAARLGGLWCVEPSFLYRSFLKHPIQHLDLFSPAKQTITSDTAEAVGFITEVDVPFPTYWVDSWTLKAMHTRIQDGISSLIDEMPLRNTYPQNQAHNQHHLLHANELVAQNAALAEQLRQARDEKASLAQQLQQAEKDIAVLKANGSDFRHMTHALMLVAEVQEQYWGDTWRSGRPPKQDVIIQDLMSTHGLSQARAKNIEYVASPIDRTTSKRPR